MTTTKETTEEQAMTGYARPLFEQQKRRFFDDSDAGGSMGDRLDIRYHDKENCLKVLNGLCYDIFFRADDVNAEWYKEVPDCLEAAEETEKKPSGPIDYRKPLDSRFRKRMPLLEPTEEKEEKPKKPQKSRSKWKRKPNNNSRNRNRKRRHKNKR